MKRRAFLRSGLAAAAAASIPRNSAFASLYGAARQQPQDVAAVTGDGRQITLTGKAIADLKARLRGRVLLAADDGYDQARRVLNPSIDKRPALIAQVTGAADIRTAIDFARENQGLLLAVKCGGHSTSGQSTCDRGMVIDLSPFRAVRVDPVARRAWVTGGSLLGQVDHEAMSYGLVTTMGTVSHTGVGGLVTGGGFGRVGRRFGLAIDNLIAVDVVSADGQFRRASQDENPDLFWGVRGGGGNFGVVTGFEFRLHPMQRQVFAGRIMYPLERARDVLNVWAEYAASAPDALDISVGVGAPPGTAPGSAGFAVCYSGPAGDVDRVLAPLRKLGTPTVDNVAAMDYVAVQRSGDVTDPRAMAVYLKSGFVPKMPPELVSAIVDGFERHPARNTGIFFQLGGGAYARVPPAATAFAQRDAHSNMLSSVAWRMGDDPAPHVAWIRQYWASLERFTHGFYVNDAPIDATAARIQENYRQNYQRLVAVKNKYDPGNLFRLNANVVPTAG
jgi:FAD/FMN-containing dehydrogenase